MLGPFQENLKISTRKPLLVTKEVEFMLMEKAIQKTPGKESQPSSNFF